MLYKKYTIEDAQKIAIERNGECLSNEYINAHKKLKWKCNKDGYIWYTSYHTISKGSWCPMCVKKPRYTIKDMYKIAKERDGECISKIYINSQTKLKWKCNVDGHIWYAIPNNIKRGSWCPLCAGVVKVS